MTDRDVYMVVLGRVLWSIRETNGLTLLQLASLSGLSTSSISRFERGERMPDLFELRGMATDRERLVRVVEHVFKETLESLKTLRANYTKDELVAVVTLVIGGVRVKDPRWIHLL